jgi:hypothetical protein
MNKAIVAVLSLLLAQSASAAIDATFTCKPATTPAPFTSFEFQMKKSFGKKNFVSFTGEFSPDAGYNPGDEGQKVSGSSVATDGQDLQVFPGKIIASGTGENTIIQTIEFQADINDWASAIVSMEEDDNGPAAFVKFTSDGPAIRSMYRCEKK